MLYLDRPNRVYVFLEPVDFRKQIDGLCALVQSEFGERPFEDAWYLFLSRDKKKIKLLYWRGTGFALWLFRLDRDIFQLGIIRQKGQLQISWSTLSKFLNGDSLFESKPHTPFLPKRFS